MPFVKRLLPSLFFALLATTSIGGKCQGDGSDRCLSDVDCEKSEACIRFPTGSQRCLVRCDAQADVRCAGGELCASTPAEDASLDVCLPGGIVAIGVACTSSVECVRGGLCFGSGADQLCRTSCAIGGPSVCASNETCTSVGDSSAPARGVCLVAGS